MTPIQRLGTNMAFGLKARKQMGQSTESLETFDKITQLCINTIKKGGRLYIAGNGGSATDASHFAAELVGRFELERAPIAAEALTTDTATITAIANDYSFDDIFTRQLEAKATPNDVFIAISTSGNSKNIVNALISCRYRNIPTILLTGKDGGVGKANATLCIVVPSDKVSVIQNVHQDVYHTLAECIENELFFKESK